MDKKFPVLGYPELKEVPWDILIDHEQQAISNHGQTLKRLAERGGLHPIEMASILRDRSYHNYTMVGPKKIGTHLSLQASLEIIADEVSRSS